MNPLDKFQTSKASISTHFASARVREAILAMGLIASPCGLVSAQNIEWLRNRSDANNGDVAWPLVVATDGNSNAVVAGSVKIPPHTTNSFLVKYTSDGTIAWERLGLDECLCDVQAWDVSETDSIGNTFVNGLASRNLPSPRTTALTAKFSPSGDVDWISEYDNEERPFKKRKTLTVGDDGSVYVGGSYLEGLRLMKIGPDGTQQWIADYPGFTLDTSSIEGAAIDSEGNIQVTGNIVDPQSGYSFAWHTLSYSPDGELRWARRSDEQSFFGGWGWRVRLTSGGAVLVGGNSSDSSGVSAMRIIKYDGVGNDLWATNISSAPGVANWLDDLVVDHVGNSYVIGWVDDLERRWTISKVNSNGSHEWQIISLVSSQVSYAPKQIAIDPSGNVIASGSALHDGTHDFAIMKITPGGEVAWTAWYGGENGDSNAMYSALGPSGAIYVTGYLNAWRPDSVITTVKFRNRPLLSASPQYAHPR